MSERDREEEILDAAHRVFLRRGTAAARMQEIADEAEVNKALLHYYFRTKDQLAQAVFRRAFQELLPAALGVLRSELGLEAKVERIVELYIDLLQATPFLPGYLLGELTHHPERVQEVFASVAGMQLGDVGAEVRSKLGEQLEEGVASGRLRAVSPEDLLMNLLSMAVFPFAAKPLLHRVLGVSPAGFAEMMEERKRTLPKFVMKALRP
jgi:TetR/AcrR family transcriptional regulator